MFKTMKKAIYYDPGLTGIVCAVMTVFLITITGGF